MTVQYNWNGSTGTNKTLDKGLDKIDGADVTAAQYNNETWWRTASNWNTTGYPGVTAWDFTNVWEWSATKQLPILRGVGGQ
jgi:hypothetical protein